MRFMPLSFGGGMNPWRGFQLRRNCRADAANSESGSVGRGSYFDKVKGFQGVAKAALTSGTMSAAGDLLAQSLPLMMKDEKASAKQINYDPTRTARMFGFGLVFYGPLQYYWYSWLEWMMPLKNTANFLIKVSANQLVLAPVVLTAVFSWNLALTGVADQIPTKIRRDLVSTMLNGWKFWIPAACINFYAVPIQHQVLYMSVCGVLWTAYLSFASTNVMVKPDKKEELVAAIDKKGKGRVKK